MTATDFARLVWRHAPPLQLKFMEHQGVVHDEVAEVLRVVSPLALEPLVPMEGRAIRYVVVFFSRPWMYRSMFLKPVGGPNE